MKRLFNTLFIILTTIFLLEIVIRICGVTPFEVQKFNIQSKPNFCLIPNSAYGFGLNSGEFDVTMNHKIHYTVTHNSDSLRIVSYSKSGIYTKKTCPENSVIDIHGCSFTYGMSVDDSLTFPFLLQKSLPNYRFRNYAVPGFGNLQALIRLQNQVKNQDFPDVVMVSYADFHDERNALNTNYRKSLYHGFLNANENVKPLFGESQIPFYDLKKGIQYCDWKNMYKNWLGRDYSAAINSLQDAFEKMQNASNDEKAVTHQILLKIKELCQQNNIKFIVLFITKNESTALTKQFCEQQNIELMDIGLELPSEKYSNLPYDIHPNKTAHRIFSERILERMSN
jgi:hypothetical protein